MADFFDYAARLKVFDKYHNRIGTIFFLLVIQQFLDSKMKLKVTL